MSIWNDKNCGYGCSVGGRISRVTKWEYILTWAGDLNPELRRGSAAVGARGLQKIFIVTIVRSLGLGLAQHHPAQVPAHRELVRADSSLKTGNKTIPFIRPLDSNLEFLNFFINTMLCMICPQWQAVGRYSRFNEWVPQFWFGSLQQTLWLHSSRKIEEP